MEHLAIVSKGTIENICSGIKTIESRFSIHRIAPFYKASAGEPVYLKESGRDITAVFEIEKVLYFEHLTPEKIEEIRENYGGSIHAEPSFWEEKKTSNYATLLFIRHPREISPIKIYKRDKSAFKSVQSLFDDVLMTKRQIIKHPGDCANGKHYFISKEGATVCMHCGFPFPHSEEMKRLPSYERIKEIMELSKWNEDWFHAELDNVAKAHMEKSKEEIRQRLIASVGTLHPNDGRQTPYYENPIYYAQHALGCCCRKCLLKFYGIPLKRKLSEEELLYFTDLVDTFIKQKQSHPLFTAPIPDLSSRTPCQ